MSATVPVAPTCAPCSRSSSAAEEHLAAARDRLRIAEMRAYARPCDVLRQRWLAMERERIEAICESLVAPKH